MVVVTPLEEEEIKEEEKIGEVLTKDSIVHNLDS